MDQSARWRQVSALAVSTPRSALPVSVVVVTWQSERVLRAALAALVLAEPPPRELIVVDNASTDDSVAVVEAFRPKLPSVDVQVIRNPDNRGFAAAANQGIARSGQPFVFLHNPDLCLRPETLAMLVGALAQAVDDVAVAGPKLLRATGDDLTPTEVIDTTGIVMRRDGRHLDRGAGELDHGQYDRQGEIFGVSGAAALFRASVLAAARVHGEVFDEDFFAFREDADLAWRLRGFGYRALFVPAAVAYHRRTVTPERRRALSAAVNMHSVKNRFLLRLHHADGGWLLRFGLPSLLRDVIVVGACLTVERSSLAAFPWLARNLARHLRRRREILGRRVVPPTELRSWFR